MNKTKLILAVTGGVLGVAVLGAAVYVYMAFSKKAAAFAGDDENEGLETYVGQVSTLMGKKPFPSDANGKRLEECARELESWRTDVLQIAAKGDWLADANCTPAQFKEGLVADAKRIAELPGASRGKLVKPDFTFGPFKDYLADKLPSREQLARLQRQWYDVMSLFDILCTNGVSEVTDLQIVERKQEAEAGAKGNAKAKAKAKPKGKAKGEGGEKEPSVETYRLSFVADPSAFVGVVRTLSFQKRFTVVDGFEFARADDAIAAALGGGEKKEAAQAAAGGGRRGRRRGGRAEEAKTEEEKQPKNASVFDPKKDAAFKVDLTVSVYDFRTLEADNEEKGDVK